MQHLGDSHLFVLMFVFIGLQKNAAVHISKSNRAKKHIISYEAWEVSGIEVKFDETSSFQGTRYVSAAL